MDGRPALGAAVGVCALAAAVALTAGNSVAEPTTSSPTSTQTSSPAPASSDSRGYLNSPARCDDEQTAAAYGRTSRSLVAVCVDQDGSLEYRGVRLGDGASLTMSAGRTPQGAIVATNDGVTYAVTPQVLLVSEGDAVLYRDGWVEFVTPRFPDTPPATSSATSRTGTPTVSTTTVTMTSTAKPTG